MESMICELFRYESVQCFVEVQLDWNSLDHLAICYAFSAPLPVARDSCQLMVVVIHISKEPRDAQIEGLPGTLIVRPQLYWKLVQLRCRTMPTALCSAQINVISSIIACLEEQAKGRCTSGSRWISCSKKYLMEALATFRKIRWKMHQNSFQESLLTSIEVIPKLWMFLGDSNGKLLKHNAQNITKLEICWLNYTNGLCIS